MSRDLFWFIKGTHMDAEWAAAYQAALAQHGKADD